MRLMQVSKFVRGALATHGAKAPGGLTEQIKKNLSEFSDDLTDNEALQEFADDMCAQMIDGEEAGP